MHSWHIGIYTAVTCLILSSLFNVSVCAFTKRRPSGSLHTGLRPQSQTLTRRCCIFNSAVSAAADRHVTYCSRWPQRDLSSCHDTVTLHLSHVQSAVSTNLCRLQFHDYTKTYVGIGNVWCCSTLHVVFCWIQISLTQPASSASSLRSIPSSHSLASLRRGDASWQGSAPPHADVIVPMVTQDPGEEGRRGAWRRSEKDGYGSLK